MKRVKRPFAAGARVYAAGAELPDDHPAVKASPRLFEPVPGTTKSTSRKPKAKRPTEDGNGQEEKGTGDADGDS